MALNAMLSFKILILCRYHRPSPTGRENVESTATTSWTPLPSGVGSGVELALIDDNGNQKIFMLTALAQLQLSHLLCDTKFF